MNLLWYELCDAFFSVFNRKLSTCYLTAIESQKQMMQKTLGCIATDGKKHIDFNSELLIQIDLQIPSNLA